MDLVGTKLLVAFLLFIERFFFGILPFKLYKWLLNWETQEDTSHFVNKKRHMQVTCMLAMGQSFGGGVLFATAFLHMMPEVYRSVEVLKDFGNLATDFPLSQLTVSLGFFLVYFVEEFSHWFITKVPEEPFKPFDTSKCIQAHLMARHPTPLSNKVLPIEDEKEQLKNGEVQIVEANGEKNVFIIDSEFYESNPRPDFYKNQERNEELNSKTPDPPSYEAAEALDNVSLNTEVAGNNEDDDDDDDTGNPDDSDNKNETKEEKKVRTKQQVVRYILVVAALSFHAIFEGLSMGLQTTTGNIWYLFVAVSIHSSTLIFYISMELLLARAKLKRIMFHILTLASSTPIGVLLGLLITLKANMNTQAKSTAVVLLEGLSAGTILYITFFEVLNREKERRIYRLRRALCILAGFTLMALLQLIEVPMDEEVERMNLNLLSSNVTH